MEIKSTMFNTMPNDTDRFWQVVLLPTISIVRVSDRYDKYTAINLEWLFWAHTTIFNNDKG